MKIKRIILFALLLLTANTAMAQSNSTPTLTLDNLIPGGESYAKFTPKGIPQLQWMGSRYLYQRGDTLWIKRPSNPRAKATTVTLAQLNTALEGVELKRATTLPQLQGCSPEAFDFVAQSHYLRYSVADQLLQFALPMEQGDENIDLAPSRDKLAVTNGNSLYFIDHEGVRTTVAHSEVDGVSYGMYGIHRNEFGIGKGTFWSPQSDKIAFYKLDQRQVSNYPLVDVQQRVATVVNSRYPMAGMSSERAKVGVYHLAHGNTIYLKTDSSYCYQTNVTWSPSGEEIYIQELNRAQNCAQLVAYSATTGKRLRVLLTERDSCYVEPQHPLHFVDNHTFIYQSRKDGYNHLYLMDIEGNELRQLTHGAWEVTALKGYDKAHKMLYIEAREASPLESHLYRLPLKGGELERLTATAGVHHTQLSDNFDYMIDSYSNHTTPRNIEVTQLKRGKVTQLLAAKNPFEGYAMPEITTGTIKAADGVTDLHYRLLKPTHFDPNTKYPTVVYVYGGPHAQMITNSWLWDARGWDIYMAQRGYVVFTVDGRGSANRGKAFEQVIHRQLGVEESRDQLEGVALLKSLPYVDADRIGVHGWSFGGFMTTNLMLRHPDTFKVGVAGGAVIDWKYYEVMYGERYMDTPKENREGYKNSSLLPLAGKLQGRLLLVHCDTDPTVVWQHTLMFLKESVKQGSYPDYFVYPGHGHNVMGIERVHLHEKITRYFDDFLK